MSTVNLANLPLKGLHVDHSGWPTTEPMVKVPDTQALQIMKIANGFLVVLVGGGALPMLSEARYVATHEEIGGAVVAALSQARITK